MIYAHNICGSWSSWKTHTKPPTSVLEFVGGLVLLARHMLLSALVCSIADMRARTPSPQVPLS
jgi:hypothetical protein